MNLRGFVLLIVCAALIALGTATGVFERVANQLHAQWGFDQNFIVEQRP